MAKRWKGGLTDFDLDHVKARIDEAHQEAVSSFVIAVDAETKINIQSLDLIDTGFMMNSVYGLWKDGSTYDKTLPSGEYAGRGGDEQKRNIAREHRLPKGADGATVVGAEYAIWQELRQSFLFKAFVTVASRARAVLEPAYRREL